MVVVVVSPPSSASSSADVSMALRLSSKESQLAGLAATDGNIDADHWALRRMNTQTPSPLSAATPPPSKEDEFDLLCLTYGFSIGSKEAQAENKLIDGHGYRALCHRIAASTPFRMAFALLITLNIVSVAVEADLKARGVDDPGVLEDRAEIILLCSIAEYCFTVIFVIEIVIRIAGSAVPVWRDAWLLADTVIVGIAALDIFVLNSLGGAQALPNVSLLRVLRAVRAVRILRLFRLVRPWRVLAEAIGEAFVNIFWIILILFVFTWSVAIAITSTVSMRAELTDEEVYVGDLFESMGSSMLTLNVVLLRGTFWGPDILYPLMHSDKLQFNIGGVFLLTYMFFSLICLLNLICGVFVNSLLEAGRRDSAVLDTTDSATLLSGGEVSLYKLKELYKDMDLNEDGMLDWDEFQAGFRNQQEFFAKLGVDADQATALFQQLCSEGHKTMNIEDFCIGLFKFKQASKTIDMLNIDHQQRKILKHLQSLQNVCDKGFYYVNQFVDNIHGELNSLTEDLSKFDVLSDQSEQGSKASSEGNPESERASRAADPQQRIVGTLENNFSFRTRREALEAKISAIVEETRSNRARSDASQQAMLRVVLCEEILQWLRQHFAAFPKSESPAAPATTTTPVDSEERTQMNWMSALVRPGTEIPYYD